MYGKWELSAPLDVLCNIHVQEISLGECVDLHDQLVSLNTQPASNVARIIRDVITKADKQFTVGLAETAPLPPKMEALFDGVGIEVTLHSDGADTYTVCGKLTAGVEKTDNPNLLSPGVNQVVLDATQDKIYHIAAFATGVGGESDLCEEVMVPVPAVETPTLSAVRNGDDITFTVAPGDDLATAYRVYQSEDDTFDAVDVMIHEGEATEFIHTNASTAFYACMAVTPIGNSEMSEAINV